MDDKKAIIKEFGEKRLLLLRRYLRCAPLSRAIIRSREIELLSNNRPSGRILDLGHGDGIYAEVLAENGISLFVGIDKSFSELKLAQKRQKKNKNLTHLVVADMEHLPFRDGAFGGAISNCVLEHIDNIEASLLETLRTLIPGGKFATTVITNRYEDLLFWPSFFRSLRLKGMANFYLKTIQQGFYHQRYLNVDEWSSLCKKVGFAVSDIQAYAGIRRQSLMDICLPFVACSKFLKHFVGREVLLPVRWPAKKLNDFLAADPSEEMIGESANILLILQRPGVYTPR